MSSAAPWSVKGIDPKAREIAKDLARREGMTLGEWMNSRIMVEGGEGDNVPLSNDRRGNARRSDDYEYTRDAASRLNAAVSELGERLEVAERRSASAIQGVDQAVNSIMRRLDMDREEEGRRARRLDDMSREMCEGHLRLQRLESTTTQPGSAQAVGALGERLDRAQEATSDALKGLERSFAALDSRMGSGVEAQSLAKLAESLTRQIEANRLDMMRRIDAATDNTRLARIEQAMSQLGAHTKAAELRSASAVEAMGQQVMNIARNMHGRMQSLEEGGEDVTARIDQRLQELGRTLDEKLDREIARQSTSLDTRLSRQEDEHALALERLGGEITRISDRLSERITQTDRRSAQAIDDIGRRLTESTEKFERRQDDASGDLAERLRQSEERTRRLIEDAREARAQRETASLNAAPRMTASLPPTDDLAFEDMPSARPSPEAAVSLFATSAGSHAGSWNPLDSTPSEWIVSAFGTSKSAPLPEAQASPGWADDIAASMAVEPFPSADTLRPFGSLDAALDEALAEDHALNDVVENLSTAPALDVPAFADEFPSIFASSEREAQDHNFEVTSPAADAGTDPLSAPLSGPLFGSESGIDPLSMTFDAESEDADNVDYDPLDAPLVSTRDVIDNARAAIAEDDGDLSLVSAFGRKNRKGGKSRLQEKLDRKASREHSTFGNALKASALAMLVVGGGGYASLKVAKDQSLNFSFGSDMDTSAAPIAALALDSVPTDAVPSADLAATEGAAIFARAQLLLDNGDPAALEALTRAAEMGYVPAQLSLATLYTEGGAGVEVSAVEARQWTRRAAEAGEPRAMQHYATQLYDGVGGPHDEAAALDWMRKSAEAGRVDAQYNLAHLYETGIKGMKADVVEAFTWYMIAARRGDQQALADVQRMTPKLSADERKRAREGADAYNVQPVTG